MVTLPRTVRRVNTFNKAIVMSTGKVGCPTVYIARFNQYKYCGNNYELWVHDTYQSPGNVSVRCARNPNLPNNMECEIFRYLVYYHINDRKCGSEQQHKHFWLNEFASWCCLDSLYGDVVFWRKDGDDIKLLKLWNVLKTIASEWGEKEKSNASYVAFTQENPEFYEFTGVREWRDYACQSLVGNKRAKEVEEEEEQSEEDE